MLWQVLELLCTVHPRSLAGAKRAAAENKGEDLRAFASVQCKGRVSRGGAHAVPSALWRLMQEDHCSCI